MYRVVAVVHRCASKRTEKVTSWFCGSPTGAFMVDLINDRHGESQKARWNARPGNLSIQG
jgi:hypothetical protein